MIIVSLKDFILTGEFGPIKLGMTKEEVIYSLGEPECDCDCQTGSGGLVYARYEFFCNQDDKLITGIQNDNLLMDVGNRKKISGRFFITTATP